MPPPASPSNSAEQDGRQCLGGGAPRQSGDTSSCWPSETVDTALRDGLVEHSGDTVKLSLAGAAFLRRKIATGDAFAAQHQVRSVRSISARETATINEIESPLGWLRNRRDKKTGKPLISSAQFEAGERLRGDFWRAQLMPRVTSDWSGTNTSQRTRRTASGSGVEMSDAVISAKNRFYAALDAVGEELGQILVAVCCNGRGLTEVERMSGWPQRSGKVALQLGLQSLARHYGLIAPEKRNREARHRILHWGGNGYRPDL